MIGYHDPRILVSLTEKKRRSRTPENANGFIVVDLPPEEALSPHISQLTSAHGYNWVISNGDNEQDKSICLTDPHSWYMLLEGNPNRPGNCYLRLDFKCRVHGPQGHFTLIGSAPFRLVAGPDMKPRLAGMICMLALEHAGGLQEERGGDACQEDSAQERSRRKRIRVVPSEITFECSQFSNNLPLPSPKTVHASRGHMRQHTHCMRDKPLCSYRRETVVRVASQSAGERPIHMCKQRGSRSIASSKYTYLRHILGLNHLLWCCTT
ncbi:hypothetical protein A0H81_12047 [Grifola frondosa]|uniref:Uncharacterized protein n=1 Tax=Grifola frondosa TaxID=5627 RepID=A0A1C7LVM1_GRIFR|nr:hypothetical protein A0H81_12047 [Grifola frondosa]